MRKILFCLLALSLTACGELAVEENSNAQTLAGNQPADDLPTDNDLRIAFYNVENLFDTEDNPQKIDEDFLPDGKYEWTPDKYQVKLKNLARAIKGMNPDVIGLAEIENRKVLQDLVDHPLIANKGYQIVHEESPDQRGIDVALLYRREAFKYQDHTAQRVDFPLERSYKSRDFLVVSGQVAQGHNLYFIVNHWPSRRGGTEESEPRRLHVASQVRTIVDKLQAREEHAKIVLMGDFNDDGANKSISQVLGAKMDWGQVRDNDLLNVMSQLTQKEDKGTLTYRGNWNLFDQFIISSDLASPGGKVSYVAESAEIYNPAWLQVGFGKGALAPRRAIFRGEFQPEGFSDHFPVVMNLGVR